MKNTIIELSTDFVQFYIKADDIIAIETYNNVVVVTYNSANNAEYKKFEFHSDYSSYKVAQEHAKKWVKEWQKAIKEDEKKVEI